MNHIERRDKELAYISDEAVLQEQIVCRKILQKLNFMDRSDFEGIAEVVKDLLGKSEGAFINPPFYCDYGTHIEVGKNFFANYNCTILDVAKVEIGNNVLMASHVYISDNSHGVYKGTIEDSSPNTPPQKRNYLIECVKIGDNVWLGEGVIVMPGVTIGNGCVIGAHSVVNKSIPDNCIAVGTPAKIIKRYSFDTKKWERVN